MPTATKSPAQPANLTTTRVNANGESEVVHPALPKAFIRVHLGGKGFQLYGEESGVTMTAITGKSFKGMPMALDKARKHLDAMSVCRAEGDASYADHLASDRSAVPPRGTYPWMDAVQDAWDAGQDIVVVNAKLDM